MIVEVEPCREGIGGLLVEVVLRHRVDVVVDQRQGFLDVAVDHLVGVGQGSALDSVRQHGCLRFGGVGDAEGAFRC